MEIVLNTGDEVAVQIVVSGRSAGIFGLHGANKVLGDLIQFISCKQVGDLAEKGQFNNSNHISQRAIPKQSLQHLI